MKKKKDMGLEYLMKLSVTGGRDAHHILNQMERAFGKEEARTYLQTLKKLSGQEDRRAFYACKNADPGKAFAYTGMYDADIIRRAGNWVASHREYFGKKILDVGCDCGLFSTFLAWCFPDAKITAIDRNREGLDVGRDIAGRLSLSNIRFLESALTDVEENFDTLFVMRCLQENRKDDDRMPVFWPLQKQVDNYYLDVLRDYAGGLCDRLLPGAHLVSIDRCQADPLLLAFWILLEAGDCWILPDSTGFLECQEAGEQTRLLAFAAQKREVKSPEAADRQTAESEDCQTAESEDRKIVDEKDRQAEDVFSAWLSLLCRQEALPADENGLPCWLTDGMDLGSASYSGWAAAAAYEALCDSCLCDVLLSDRKGMPAARYAIAGVKKRPDWRIRYEATFAGQTIRFFSGKEEEETIASLKQHLDQLVKRGYKVCKTAVSCDSTLAV